MSDDTLKWKALGDRVMIELPAYSSRLAPKPHALKVAAASLGITLAEATLAHSAHYGTHVRPPFPERYESLVSVEPEVPVERARIHA